MPMVWWLDMFFHTHPMSDDLRRAGWPDGGSYFEQDNILIEVFDLMKSESIDYLNEKRKRDGK